MHNEVHVVLFDNGHINSIDCWCEPTDIRRVRNKHGIDVLVVEHHDFSPVPRDVSLFHRNSDIYTPFSDPINKSIDAPWITRILAPYGDPPLLPPHDPHSREI